MRTPPFAPPSSDKRWRIINATMRRYGYSAGALIETLHMIQETFGHIDETAMRYASKVLRVPLSQVYGVVTFYNHFVLKPRGAHSCVICMGTACYIKNSQEILKVVEEMLKIEPGQTTDDGRISLSVAHCVGTCWQAPVLMLDDEVQPEKLADEVVQKMQEWVTHVHDKP